MINEERRKIQNEAISALETNNYNGIFLLPTGVGKSYVLIECLKRLIKLYDYKKIWYLCNSTILRDVDFKKEMIEWGAEDIIDRVEFMCYQKACKLTNQKVDVLIADEFDYSITPKYSKVYDNSFKHKILTTAHIDEKKIEKANEISKIVYSTDLNRVERDGVLNKSKYFIVNFLMSDAESKQYIEYNRQIAQLLRAKEMGGSKLIDYKLDVITRERKRFLNALNSSSTICRKLMKDIYNEDKQCKILIFCELTKQADAVCKYSYHTESDQQNLEKFRNNEIQAMSVCGKVNRGTNIPGVKYLILESCNGSKTQIIQRLGRGKRLKFDEVLNVYFLIPHYYENGKIKPTKVKDWIYKAVSGLDLSDTILYRFKN